MKERTFKHFILYFLIALGIYTLLAIFMVGSFTEESWSMVFFERRFSRLPYPPEVPWGWRNQNG